MNNIALIKEDQNSRYRRKYKYLKMMVKSLIVENAAVCDEVAKIQESISIVKDERKFLLRKLLEYDQDHDVHHKYIRNVSGSTHIVSNGTGAKVKKRCSPEDNERRMS